MDSKNQESWLTELHRMQHHLEAYLWELKHRMDELPVSATAKKGRPEGVFRYLELPIMLDNLLAQISRPTSTTELTDILLHGREVDQSTWASVNRHVSQLLNSRMRQGYVRKVGRVQGSNRAVLWECID